MRWQAHLFEAFQLSWPLDSQMVSAKVFECICIPRSQSTSGNGAWGWIVGVISGGSTRDAGRFDANATIPGKNVVASGVQETRILRSWRKRRRHGTWRQSTHDLMAGSSTP